MKKKYVRAGQLFLNGNEALVAQLQSLEDTGILEQTVPGTEVTWGTIVGNIEDQTDLVNFVNELVEQIVEGEISIDLTKYALKTDLETLQKQVEAIKIPTKVSELQNDAGYLTQHQDISNLATKDEFKALEDKAVTYKDFEYQGQTRKTIELANYNTLSGLGTDGSGYNLAMISKWDVADFGSPSVHMNLNTKDTVTINDDKQIATQQDVTDAVAAIDLTPYAIKAEADKDYAKAETLLPGIVTDVFGQIIYNPYNVQVAYNKAIKHGTAGDEIEYVEEPAERHNFVIDGATAEKAGVLAAADKAKLDALNIDLLATKEEVAEKANASEVYTKTEIDAKIASVYVYKGSVATQAELPQENNKVGDTYNVTDTGHNYTWDGTQWDDLGGTIDLSAYATTEALNTGLAAKANTEHTHVITEVTDLQSVLDGKQPVGNYPVYLNYGTAEEPRLSLELKNHDSISGLDTTGLGHNLAMVSQWDVADFGATGLHMNLNTKNNVTINDDKVVATTDDVEDVKKLTPVMVQIPIRTKSTFNTVQDKETILGWFGCTQDSELKGLISRQQPMFLKYGISLSTNPHYYKMPIQYIAYESANQVKIVTIGLDTNNDVVSKYEILMNLDGTVIENGGNVKMTITALESAETIATLQETIAQLTSRIEALEQA